MKWFAVKTLYRSTVETRPEKPDLFYDPDATLVEERVLLIKAKSRGEALDKAGREAGDYVQKTKCFNPYNQEILTRLLPFMDVYELSGNPGDKMEIFATTRLMSCRIPDRKVAQVLIGPKAHDKMDSKRKKFMNRDYQPQDGDA
ncbi:MAG: DUF4288 domain-containing protein [Candidatus Omnitrophota bacterium]|nr:DUF4288 domain-containing protein [Candidatus Omnitrophota bacterium]MDZ4241671.1 DUF4288 domain-containing protein [Candidatus Omnitrophota bacterium]